MKKVLLSVEFSVVEPLGIMYLSSALKKRGHQVEIVLVKDIEDLRKRLVEFQPDYLGISIYTGVHKKYFEFVDCLRKGGVTLKIPKVIFGGAHATYFADDALKHGDFVVIGPGAETIGDIVDGVLEEGKSHIGSQTDIGIPDRDEFYKSSPYHKNNPIKNVITGTGCPFGKCTYCYLAQKHNPWKKIRLRTPESVVEECLSLQQYPLKHIFFEDDVFGYDLKWLKKFSKMYSEQVSVPFHCQMRLEVVSPPKLDLLKQSGCLGITTAIECSNESIRREILKRGELTNDEILNRLKMIKDWGFSLRTEAMLGLPFTSTEDELELLRWNCIIKPDLAWVSVFMPYLGTELGDLCKEIGLYTGNNDDIPPTFFDSSKLDLSPTRKDNIRVLLKYFALLSYIPQGHILARKLLDSKHPDEDLFKTTRGHLYDYAVYRVAQ